MRLLSEAGHKSSSCRRRRLLVDNSIIAESNYLLEAHLIMCPSPPGGPVASSRLSHSQIGSLSHQRSAAPQLPAI